MGDTEISLHIRSPRFRALYSGVKTENTQIPEICLNFNFQAWGGGGTLESKLKILKVPRYQDMPKFKFFWGGGYSGVKTENTRSAKICLNFNFQWSEIPERGTLV